MGLRVLAFGKINLYLDVLGKRADNFHEVAMIMQSVRLADVIDITEASENIIHSNSRFLPNNEQNLAMRAAVLMQSHYDLPKVKIHINKQLPVSAGMAGGSTDAAAVLIALNELGGLHLPVGRLMELGAELGSDVPFCVGSPTAIALGRGEVILPMPVLPKWHLVVVKPNFGVSTPNVYKHYKKHPSCAKNSSVPSFENYLKALQMQNDRFIYAHMFNALELATFSLYPRVEKIKRKIQLMCGESVPVLMSGSGPTVFAAFKEEKEAWKFFRILRKEYKQTYLTSTVDEKDLAIRMTHI